MDRSELLAKWRGLQSIIYQLSYTTPYDDLISGEAEMLSQAVTTSVGYTGPVLHSNAMWNTIEIQELVGQMQRDGRRKLAALEALYHDSFDYMIPSDRGEPDEPESLASSDIAMDLIYSNIGRAAEHTRLINEALSNRVNTAQHTKLKRAVEGLEGRMNSFETWLENMGSAKTARVSFEAVKARFQAEREQNHQVDQTRPVAPAHPAKPIKPAKPAKPTKPPKPTKPTKPPRPIKPARPVKQAPAMDDTVMSEDVGEATPEPMTRRSDRNRKPSRKQQEMSATENDEEIARVEQEQEFNEKTPSPPRTTKPTEPTESPPQPAYLTQRMAEHDRGELQLTDPAIPMGSDAMDMDDEIDDKFMHEDQEEDDFE
ncbi:hypothetical protein CLAFUW4_06092 [Fulvia fulva]|uniref:Uncharacterized protein n=1 Tax=Passalora fulva TaxID=5499 RepID=A0A9Q8LH62_PASFU|nr:uncharacterized protein CLAFUR5_06236 [Fulvia fulva]KAK4623642.1 hypothetical protein CLAFUR4_06096 [Fulvia fulva]KAK4625119.1 hypothetical protein CLAFUR0_06100 [Fulvia fulva]UJO17405.1 hypothetical protein CLAFUR5_06236 [Fulvia fulva]WPV14736.1 hypothetical protein CLAFUW4_06092 [Fulvia fulva]WPV29414.1 hypothetical protein CLAFUW7_06089 [Fulvia fulva]